jgi:predicted dehydrogenase
MIQVGIVGSLTAINKHTEALHQIQELRITGCWITGDDHGPVTEAETGFQCISASTITRNADALIIAAGGDFCLDLAIAALRTARHVFLYPPALRSVSDASHLIKLAREAGVILRAGKTGSYNVRGLMETLRDRADINMIELQHDYKVTDHDNRNGIHGALLADLEVISSLVGARVTSIKAKGHCMLSSEPDIINARLEFDNGCAVNYNCSLVAATNDFQGTLCSGTGY